MVMTGAVLAASAGLLVGLVAQAALIRRVRPPLWLTLSTAVAAALLGTTAARFAGTARSPLDSMPFALLAPMFFACVGVAVLTFTTRESSGR